MIRHNFSEPILHLLSVSHSHCEPETILSTIYEHSSDGIFILEPVSWETSLDTYSPPSHLSTTPTHSQPDAIDLSKIYREKDAVTIAQRILNTLLPPFDLAGHQVTMGCSIGIALYPEDAKILKP
jgi:hypothetical protein